MTDEKKGSGDCATCTNNPRYGDPWDEDKARTMPIGKLAMWLPTANCPECGH